MTWPRAMTIAASRTSSPANASTPPTAMVAAFLPSAAAPSEISALASSISLRMSRRSSEPSSLKSSPRPRSSRRTLLIRASFGDSRLVCHRAPRALDEPRRGKADRGGDAEEDGGVAAAERLDVAHQRVEVFPVEAAAQVLQRAGGAIDHAAGDAAAVEIVFGAAQCRGERADLAQRAALLLVISGASL